MENNKNKIEFETFRPIGGFEVTQMTAKEPTCFNGWVSCAERLPEKHEAVLFFDTLLGNGEIVIDYPDSSDPLERMPKRKGMSHWMPLPQPPTQKG